MCGTDLKGIEPRFGHIIPDHPVLGVDKVRYYGEPVALVIAEFCVSRRSTRPPS